MKKPLASSAAKFLSLGVLSPSKAETPPQEFVTPEANERSEDVKPLVKTGKRSLVKGLKGLGIVLLLGIFLAACSTRSPEDIEAQAKKALPHVGTSKIHRLDPEEYWELQKIIIQNGGDPSPSNVDALYDSRH